MQTPHRARDVAAARSLVALANPAQRQALLTWAQEIVAIRDSQLAVIPKARRAIAASVKSDVLIPLLRRVPSELRSAGYESKRLVWDNRGWAARLALIGITIGSAGFSGQAAGIAALGRAVGVPLWLVLGAGGAFIGALVEELSERPLSTTYTVIEARRIPSVSSDAGDA